MKEGRDWVKLWQQEAGPVQAQHRVVGDLNVVILEFHVSHTAGSLRVESKFESEQNGEL